MAFDNEDDFPQNKSTIIFKIKIPPPIILCTKGTLNFVSFFSINYIAFVKSKS